MPNLTIYTANHCPYSKKLRDFLYEQGIPFDEIALDRGHKQAKELQGVNADLKTPVVVIKYKDAPVKYIGWNEVTRGAIAQYSTFS